VPFLGTRGAGTNKAFGFSVFAKPNQVTGLTATDFGTSRAYNNGRIDLSWTAPANNGATISGYFIERSTNGSSYSTLVANTASGATTYSDTSLTSSQVYYYKVSAINAAGTGDASTAASATATTVPQAPTIGTAADGGTGTTATVTYTAGATGGAAVSTFTATSSPGSLTGTGASPITVSGLTTGTAYTFTLTATNANGTSTASAASNSITPIVPTSFESIATFTGSGQSSVTFSSIPQTYKSLQIRINAVSGTGGTAYTIYPNNNSSNIYRTHTLDSNGSTVTASNPFGLFDRIFIMRTSTVGTADNGVGAAIVDVIDYASTSKAKTFKYISGSETNGLVPGYVVLGSASGYDTTAISSLVLSTSSGTTFQAGCSIALYGVK
jgi:hypothetical protein